MGVTQVHNPNCTKIANKMIQTNTTNRRRSFKRRRLEQIYCWLGAAIICILLQNVASASAVPMDSSSIMRIHNMWTGDAAAGMHLWHHRVARDVAVDAAMESSSLSQKEKDNNAKDAPLQGSSTESFLDQSKDDQCLLDGEYVSKATVYCAPNNCRPIQKSDHCCPDYKCDCQKDGKTYLNGHKLVDPETPCTVCYCQGGEILCSPVTCYHRDDCTPKYTAGVCCPEYDNCPVSTSESPINKTLTTTSTTFRPEMLMNENHPKITIKEITKPTEIRITDDNKQKIHEMLKPTTTTSTTTAENLKASDNELTTTTATTSSTTTLQPQSAAADSPTIVDAIKSALQQKLNEEKMSVISADTNHNSNGNEITTKVGINSGDTLKLTASVAYPPLTPHALPTVLSVSISSTISPMEVSSEVEEDPVPALSVFSTQGLPQDPSKVNIKREYFITTEGIGSIAQFYDGSGEYANTDLIYGGSASPTPQQTLVGIQSSSAEFDPETAGSDNIYHIILTTDGPRLATTSENYLAVKGFSSTEVSPFEDYLNPIVPASPADSMSLPSTTVGPVVAKDDYMKSTTETNQHHHHHHHLDEEEIPLDINPAYPSLPADDFSIRGENNYQTSENDEISEEPRSIATHVEHDMEKNSKHLEDVSYGSGSGSGSGMDVMIEELVAMPTSTEGSGGMDLHPGIPEAFDNTNMKIKAPAIIQFMYSAEDSSEETRIANSSDFQMEAMKKSEDSSLESTEMLKPIDSLMSLEFGSGSGSGAGEIVVKKEREPTTARPNKGVSSIDIDEIASASGNGPQEDPKEDAESLKLDENQTDNASDSDKSPKGNILSTKVQTAQREKAFNDELV